MYLLVRSINVVGMLVLILGFGCHCIGGEVAPPQTQSPQKTLNRYEYPRYMMGMQGRVVLYAPDDATAEDAAREAFARVAELDQIASDWRASSELMRLCRQAGEQPVPVSADLFALLQRSCALAQASDGAFDPTAGALTHLWRKARKEKKLPTSQEIAQARQRVGWRKIKLDPQNRTVQLLEKGMILDLGAIAKGYGCDAAMTVLKAHGITRALFEMGGEIVVGEAPPDKPGWLIELLSGSSTRGLRAIYLTNTAISTSGDTEQYIIIDGQRYSHVIDPRTGQALKDRMLVTVLADDATTSDSLSTAASVMGPRAAELLKAYPNVELFIRKAADE